MRASKLFVGLLFLLVVMVLPAVVVESEAPPVAAGAHQPDPAFGGGNAVCTSPQIALCDDFGTKDQAGNCVGAPRARCC